MEDQPTLSTPKRNPITWISGGCLAVLYLALCIVLLILGRMQMLRASSAPTTATPTLGPQVLYRPAQDANAVIHEDFSSNKREWGLFFDYGKMEVIDGKLVLQSDVPSGYGVAISDRFSTSSKKYYLQANLSTDVDTRSAYGLIFGLNKSLVTYYMFELWPQAGGFRVYKFNAGKWMELIPFSKAEINPYPQANTLGVYFDEGKMQFSINGKQTAEYEETNFLQSTNMGVFASQTGYRLLVDDFFMYAEK